MYSLKLTMGFLAAEIHPDLVEEYERKEWDRLLDFVTEAGVDYLGTAPESEVVLSMKVNLDPFRARVIDHNFILHADSYLKKRTAAKPFQRYKIIQALFLSAFNEAVEEQMVRTVTRRYEEEMKSR